MVSIIKDEVNMGSVEEASSPIPEDVLFKEILSKLPVKSLLRFKCVSKRWLIRISSDSFVADHIAHQTTMGKPSDLIMVRDRSDYINKLYQIGNAELNPVELDMSYVTKPPQWLYGNEEVLFYGCSNGLLFIHQYSEAKNSDGENVVPGNFNLVLWNPATKHFMELPEPVEPVLNPGIPRRFLDGDYGLGFGKDCNNYKIVEIEGLNTSDLNIQLFTKRSGCWTHLETITNAILVWNTLGGSVVDGFMHWVILRGDSPGIFTRYKILTFDLDTDELIEIDGPDIPNYDETFNVLELTKYTTTKYLKLFKWNGSLGFLNPIRDEHHFWLKSNDRWTYMSLYTITTMPRGCFIGVFRDWFLFFNFNIMNHVLVDPVTKKDSPFSEEYRQIHPHSCYQYIPSLISPRYA